MAVSTPQADDQHVVVGKHTYRAGPYSVAVVAICSLLYMFAVLDLTNFGVALPAMVKALHASPARLLAVLGVSNIVGVVVPFLIGPLADRFGRRLLIQLVMLLTGAFGALTGAVTGLWQVYIVRSLANSGLQVGGLTGTMISEESLPRYRGFGVSVMQATSRGGPILGGLIGALLLPLGLWRLTFVIPFVPVLLLTIAAMFLREPPQFVAQQRSKVQRSTFGSEIARVLAPAYRRQALIVWGTMAFVNVVTPAVENIGPLYLVRVAHLPIGLAASLVGIAGLVAIPSQLLVGALTDRYPPKYFMSVCALAGGFGTMLFSRSDGNYAFYVLAVVLSMFFIQGVWGATFRFASESFPSEVRATGVMITSSAATLGAIFMPFIFAALFTAHQAPIGWFITGGLACVGGLLILFARNVAPRQPLGVAANIDVA